MLHLMLLQKALCRMERVLMAEMRKDYVKMQSAIDYVCEHSDRLALFKTGFQQPKYHKVYAQIRD